MELGFFGFCGTEMAKVTDIHGKERRRDRRRGVILDGRLDGHPVRVLDVGFGGIQGAIEISGESEQLPIIGREYRLELDDGSGTVWFVITVVRVNLGKGLFGAHFTGLDDEQYRNLERLILGRSTSGAPQRL